MFRRHLERQYRDRMRYWQSRSLSRLGLQSNGDISITITVDSMDHGKFCYPKGLALGAKDFGSFIRPCLTCTAAVIHGFGVVIVLAEPYVHQTSSWTCDVVAHCTHILSQVPGLDLRRAELILFGDNSSKELKNNSIMRLLGGLVACQKIRCGELRTLESGHSHEDLDQTFSVLAGHLNTVAELWTPYDYLRSIQDWLHSVRQHEPRKAVFLVNQIRSWSLSSQCIYFFSWSGSCLVVCSSIFCNQLFLVFHLLQPGESISNYYATTISSLEWEDLERLMCSVLTVSAKQDQCIGFEPGNFDLKNVS